jgi:hypothetical protein
MGGFLGDLLKSNLFAGKDIVKGIFQNPVQTLLGANTPLAAKAFNTVLGTHFEPQINDVGGVTSATWGRAEKAGINTSGAKAIGKVADTVAAIWGAAGAAGALAGGSGAATGGTGVWGMGSGGGEGMAGSWGLGGTGTGAGVIAPAAPVAGDAFASGSPASVANNAGGISATAAPGSVTGSGINGALGTAMKYKDIAGLGLSVLSSAVKPKAPETPTTLEMPVPNAAAQEAARKKAIAEQLARSGRAASILTSPSRNRLGG